MPAAASDVETRRFSVLIRILINRDSTVTCSTPSTIVNMGQDLIRIVLTCRYLAGSQSSVG